MRRPGAFVALLVALALGGLATSFFATHERVTEEVEAHETGLARRNPFLALERFLVARGHTIRPLADGSDDLAGTDVLLFFAPRETTSRARRDALLAWVATGGVLVATPAEADEDPLLGPFGVRRASPPAGPEPRDVEVALRAVAGRVRPTRPDVVDGRAAALEASPSRASAVVLVFPHGSGRVVVLSDAGMFSNRRIREAAHARLALALVEDPAGESAVVSLVRRDAVPSLLSLLVRHAGAAVLTFVAGLAAFLAMKGRRFGPIRQEDPPDRRRLLEHIDAAGAYLFARGDGAALVAGAREAVRTRLARRDPTLHARPERARVARLAALARLPAARVERALHGPPPATAEELTSAILTLETVRRSL